MKLEEAIKADIHCDKREKNDLFDFEEGCKGCPLEGKGDCIVDISKTFKEFAYKYRWHYRPEGGWTDETLPEIGTQNVLYKYKTKDDDRPETVICDVAWTFDKCLAGIWKREDVYTMTMWMYIPPTKEEKE